MSCYMYSVLFYLFNIFLFYYYFVTIIIVIIILSLLFSGTHFWREGFYLWRGMSACLERVRLSASVSKANRSLVGTKECLEVYIKDLNVFNFQLLRLFLRERKKRKETATTYVKALIKFFSTVFLTISFTVSTCFVFFALQEMFHAFWGPLFFYLTSFSLFSFFRFCFLFCFCFTFGILLFFFFFFCFFASMWEWTRCYRYSIWVSGGLWPSFRENRAFSTVF